MVALRSEQRRALMECLEELDGIRAELDGIRADIRKEMRRQHFGKTLAERVEWEREFGAECDSKFPGRAGSRSRMEYTKMLAREFGLPYATVKAAFADVWATRDAASVA